MQSPRRDKGSEEPLVVNDKLELWGGLECTINRVGNTWMDQMRRCGHTERPGDLQLIRELGIRKLRYGLQWERYMQAGSLEVFRDSLAEMERLGMEPIAGLVHHGSGPEGTDLLDPEFGTKLAGYARQVAARFPSVRSYTPVNEPHTTARFSGLYAHWYPHHRSFRAYLRALVNQVKASVLAMEAIREVRPDAEFVHTEDAGRTWSTPELAPLCELRENRRWLGTDLLCGRVGRDHPLFPYLLSHGISEAEIFWFAEHPCPPSVLGLNYYVTSDRFLDHRTERYPDWLAGGDDGTEPLVDIEAVRLRRGGIAGSCEILREAWERYGLPVAITEAHLGGIPQSRFAGFATFGRARRLPVARVLTAARSPYGPCWAPLIGAHWSPKSGETMSRVSSTSAAGRPSRSPCQPTWPRWSRNSREASGRPWKDRAGGRCPVA